MAEIHIAINPQIMSAEELKEHLSSRADLTSGELVLETRKSPVRLRGLDPTVLVAIIGTLGTGFGALLTGLLQVAQKSKEKKIVMQTKSGQRLEFPADVPQERIDHLIKQLREMDDPSIKIAIL